MDAQSLKELSSPEYWNKRYDGQARGNTYEWFKKFEQLRPFLEKHLPAPRSTPRILHLGCGDSVRIAVVEFEVGADISLQDTAIRLAQPWVYEPAIGRLFRGGDQANAIAATVSRMAR